MKVIVVGGDGFVGSHIVDILITSGHQVTVFDRCPYGVTKNLEHLKGSIRIISGEFANREELRNAIKGNDIVFHLVWASTPITSWKDPYLEIEENIRLSVQLAEIAAEEGVRKLIFPSSGGTVYGSKPGMLVSEDVIPQPFCPYGISKLAVEHFFRYFRKMKGTSADIYRIANAYGPRQPISSAQGVIAVWMSRIRAGKKIFVYGDSTTVRDYVYVKDIAKLMLHSLKDLELSETLNIGSGKGTSIMDLLDIFKRVIGKSFEYEVMKKRPSDNTSIVLDNSRIKAHLPEFAFSDLEEKLAETWVDFTSRMPYDG